MRTPPRQLPKVLISQDKDKDFENAAIFFAKKNEKKSGVSRLSG